MYEFAVQLALAVFNPNRYTDGKPWIVSFVYKGKTYSKQVANHSTAQAWANYMERKGHRFIRLQKV